MKAHMNDFSPLDISSPTIKDVHDALLQPHITEATDAKLALHWARKENEILKSELKTATLMLGLRDAQLAKLRNDLLELRGMLA